VNFFVTVFMAEEGQQFDPDKVTPGVVGFIAIAGLAVAVIFLVIDMNKRMRRIQYREEVRDLLAIEIAERDAAAAGGGVTEADPALRAADEAAAQRKAEAEADEASGQDYNGR
jgi:hypothetical protein